MTSEATTSESTAEDLALVTSTRSLALRGRALDHISRPILNRPHEEPSRHWRLAEDNTSTGEQIDGRRLSQALVIVPKERGAQLRMQVTPAEQNELVNRIRDAVAGWRNADYRGATTATRQLLQHWRSEANDPRLFFAQVEAAETLIWLTEANAVHYPVLAEVRRDLADANRDYNDGIGRLAVRMATGSGKTAVMGMVIAWHAVNAAASQRRDGRYTTCFLAITPGHTVRERLAVLHPAHPENVYDEMRLVPEARRSALGAVKVRVLNYHAFQQRDRLSAASSDAKKLLRAGHKAQQFESMSAEHAAAVMVAAEDVTVPGEMVREAAREITDSAERADLLLVVAYAYAADAPAKVGRIAVARAQMNRDLMIRELSDETGHEAFVIVGEPDIRILDDYPNGQIAVEVLGYDTFDPATGNAAEGGPDDVACWMLDTDHDGESFYARRIHFPGAENDRQIKKLLKELGRHADDAEQEALTAMRSAPFDPPEQGRIAVKIITATGMEMTTVQDITQ